MSNRVECRLMEEGDGEDLAQSIQHWGAPARRTRRYIINRNEPDSAGRDRGRRHRRIDSGTGEQHERRRRICISMDVEQSCSSCVSIDVNYSPGFLLDLDPSHTFDSGPVPTLIFDLSPVLNFASGLDLGQGQNRKRYLLSILILVPF
ncbi:hypothetical protein EVAR_21141_1 [Eumeta japonica]|uniref:Uncharacterized protein n=1 Tax=Eumeta variegata TaxID=151549 RepID=A0A4C1VWD5_EUMVA|nr:hypothetical protein EVAR_21141_1 [Eumeta japonica]